ncbi:MAG: hypothetical protein ACRDNF_15545, partial [Streptosporangiaceae bacterium]
MTSPLPGPTPDGPAPDEPVPAPPVPAPPVPVLPVPVLPAPVLPVTARRPRAILVEDHLERRIRKPVDLLRFVVSGVGVVLLGLLGIVASATTTGVETDIVDFSRRMPYTAFATARSLVLFALLILPVALAVRQLVRRQGQRLWEAALTGLLTFVAVSVADALLRHGAATQLYDAIVMAKPGTSHMTALDGYLAGLAAFTTMIGLSGRHRWQVTMWLVVCGYALVNLAALHTTVLSLLITLLLGRTIGLAVRYVAGATSLRPSAEQIATALGTVGCELTEMRRVPPAGGESRHYAATARDGGRLDVFAYDQDQQAAGAFYRLYRLIRLQTQASHAAPLSVDRAVERRALLSYAARSAG